MQQRKRLLHREQDAFYVDIEDLVVEILGDLAKSSIFRSPGIANTISSLPFSRLICAKRRSRFERLDTSSCMVRKSVKPLGPAMPSSRALTALEASPFLSWS